MGIDFTKMFEGFRAGYNAYKKENGAVNAEDIANKMLWLPDKATAERLKSIFIQAALQDSNKELSEAEFEQVITSDEFKELVSAHYEEQTASTLNARELENTQHFGLNKEVEKTEISPTGTPRDHIVAEKGEWFANEIYDPMKKFADEALKYMQENNGTLENFTFTGLPLGVRVINLAPSISYLDDSNDTFSIQNGQSQTIRHADSIQAMVVFEHQGDTYRLFSDTVAEDLGPWGNPSYNESDIEAWGSPVEDTTSAITGEPHTKEPDETVPKEKS